MRTITLSRRPWVPLLLGLAPALFCLATARAGVSTSAQWTIDGPQDGEELGWSVSTAGDVNVDGYSDVIVGEPRYDGFLTSLNGRARIFLGGPSGVSSTAAWSVIGPNNSQFGTSVSTAGDVNGDGFDDVIVGAPFYSNDQTTEGLVRVYLGSASGPSTTAAWQREGNADLGDAGYSVSTAGDVNGDGYDDVVFGSPNYTGTQASQGRAQIILGGASGLSASIHRTVQGVFADDKLGSRVATGGDVNGDGYDDVLVAAWYTQGIFGPANAGGVYGYFGSASGVDGTSDWSDFGTQTDEYYGASIALAGDVNGDGYSDVLVGTGQYTNGQANEGGAFLYYGSATGLPSSPSITYESNQADAYLGDCVATAGDVNADGYADLLLAAQNYDAGQADEGQVWVYYGSPDGPATTAVWSKDGDEASAGCGWSAATAGDVNGDGRSDILIGIPFFDNGAAGNPNPGRAQVYLANADDYTSIANFVAENNQANAGMGSCVGFADVNGDGYSDLLGSSWFYSAGETNEGRVYCWHGGYDGISNPSNWFKDGNQVNAFLGRVIDSAGDVNGDGYEDVIVTASGYDEGLADAGKAFVYNGSPAGLAASPSWTAAGGQAGANFGWSAAHGDVNGDGYADVVIGAPDWNNPQTDEGAALLFYGSASGLSPSAANGWEGNQDNASGGFSVAMADVNGDGYSDIISGVPLFDNGQANEGMIQVFFGGVDPLSPSPSQTIEGNSVGAKFGIGVASAGDVNSDGYGDVIVGASGYTNGESQEGRVYLLVGSPLGLHAGATFNYEPNSANAYFGEWVSGIGDVNADGYADIAVGAPGYNSGAGRVYVFAGTPTGSGLPLIYTLTGTDGRLGAHVVGGGDVDGDGYPDLAVGAPDFTNGQSGEGQLYLFQGNRNVTANHAAGFARILHGARYDNANRIAPLGKSEAWNGFRVRTLARSAFGRSRVRVQYEVQPLGTDWLNNGPTGAWLDSGAPLAGQGSRVAFNQQVSGLSSDTAYHFRARCEGESPYFPRTPWFSPAGNGPMETDLRTTRDASDVADHSSASTRVQFAGAFPNPVMGATQLRFSLAQSEHVRLTLHDVSGRRVATLADADFAAGANAIEWSGRGVNDTRLVPGVYFARLAIGARGGETQAATARIVVGR